MLSGLVLRKVAPLGVEWVFLMTPCRSRLVSDESQVWTFHSADWGKFNPNINGCVCNSLTQSIGSLEDRHQQSQHNERNDRPHHQQHDRLNHSNRQVQIPHRA